MPPFPLPTSTKFTSKPNLGMHRCFDRSWHRFFNELGSIWEANLAPCCPLFTSKCGSAVARSPLFCWVYVLLLFFGQPGPLLAPFGLDFWGTGLDFEGFLDAIFFILFKFLDFIFPKALALCWSTFFTRIWCWMGWWGYAKSKAFILFDLIRFEFSSLQGARILEPKTTTKFWSSRGLQKFVAVLGSRVIDFTWLDSLWISFISMLKYFLH